MQIRSYTAPKSLTEKKKKKGKKENVKYSSSPVLKNLNESQAEDVDESDILEFPPLVPKLKVKIYSR